MKKQFWKLYYKITLKKDYNRRMAYANYIVLNTLQSTAGKSNHFRDSKGDEIRGWYRKLPKFEAQHPLITRYQ